MEFTDRYGGRPPSWLRACHGECEAMGYVPVDKAHPIEGRWFELWLRAHDAEEHECDGWHFVKCPDCHGSGRVSWLRSVARVPRWLIKGARFIWTSRTYPGPMEGQSRWAFFRVQVWAAWGADLRSLLRS